MHNLLVLDYDSLGFIEGVFITEFLKTYWNNIALVIPVVRQEEFGQSNYCDAINRGVIPDWLFAIATNPNHPLDIDWIFLRPRQLHPWGYGSHPATSNFNGGASTTSLYENLAQLETLAEDGRMQSSCIFLPDLYTDNPPKTFEFLYSFDLFRNAKRLAVQNRPSFDDLYRGRDHEEHISKQVCLGLYGCTDKTLNMTWRVESIIRAGSWTSSTTELADKVTLALRRAGTTGHCTEVAPLEAFGQWLEHADYREPLLIRLKDNVLFCIPEVLSPFNCDAYFLDCQEEKMVRCGANGEDPKPILKDWGISPEDTRLKFLFR